MSLINDLRKDMFEASKNGEADKANILKMVVADIKNKEKEIGEELKDSQVEEIMRKQVKKIKDSISEYEKMDRKDLIEKEKLQLEVLEEYLPELMSKEEIEEIVKDVVEKQGAESMRDMGKVMGGVMGQLKGKADGNDVKDVVQNLLS